MRDNKQQIRDKIIKLGVDNNFKASTIDKVLKDYGIKEKYNPLTSPYNWKHMATRLPENAIEFGKDALTFGGMVAKPFMDIADTLYSAKFGDKLNSAKQVANREFNTPTMKRILAGAGAGAVVGSNINKVGAIPGAIIGGAMAYKGPEAFGDAMVAPYNTTARKAFGFKEDWRNIVQGAQNNPIYSGVDVLSAGGGKLIGGVTHNVGNVIPKDAPLFIRQLIPNSEVRKINRNISDTLVKSKSDVQKNYNAYGVLESTPNIDRVELARHIIEGRSKLKGRDKKLGDAIRSSLVANEKLGIDLGLLDSNLSKADTIAQYVMQGIPRGYNLLHRDYRNIITTGKTGRELADKIISKNKLSSRINELIKEGSELYDKNGIAYLTQKLATTIDPLKDILAGEINRGKKNYFDVTREIGRATPQQLANVIDESIKFQLDQISNAKEFENILDSVLNNTSIGSNLTKEEIALAKVNALKSISKDIANSKLPNLESALAKTGLKGKIDPLYYKSLENIFKRPMNKGLRSVLSTFKKNVLATPHWFFLNRFGNWPNNIMEGVKGIDYIDTIRYKKYIPEQLKKQTSFSSYLNEGIENLSDSASIVKRRAGSTWSLPYTKIKRALEQFKNSGKALEDIGVLARDLYTNTNDFIANPIFRLEANAELMDRYANYIRQAKRLAKKKKVSVGQILKEAKDDDRLFRQLNTEVNKSLGDYVGRQYSLPSGLYDLMAEWFPFYRFYNQTLRTTAHQLANNPIPFQSLIQVPNKYGKREREKVERIFKFDPKWYKGGIPYGYTAGGNVRTVGTEPQPIQTVIGLLGDIGKTGNITSIVNPFISGIGPAVYFQKFGKQATTPRADEIKRSGIGSTEQFEPTFKERLEYLLNAGLGSTSSLYNWSTRIVPELIAPFVGGVQTKYDTNPFLDIPSSYNRVLPSETMMKQLGVKTYSNFEKKRKSKSSKKKDIRNAKYQRKKEQQSKQPLKRIYK